MKAVILAGGIGTRLWPLSREATPKQFQKLADTKKTMLQQTVERIDFLNNEDIFIATNREFVDEVKRQLPDIPAEHIIAEPALRDTATCIGYAAMRLSVNSPDEVMAIIYADHLVKDPEEFKNKLLAAEKVARDQKTLNIIEVKARFPNVNLGYVQVGEKIEEVDDNDIYEFKKFTEKPDLETAKNFIESGNYLWNTGMYVWRIDRILEKYKKHLPDTYERLIKMKNSIGTENEKTVIEKEYSACEKISIDYAIMEKVDPSEVRIIPAEFGWSDVGTWESIHDELTESDDENVISGKFLGIDTKGSLIRTENPKKIIAAIGLEDIVVVDTEDALLVCPKNRSQDVKKIVEKLKEQGDYL